jgi:uncharacterized ferritin-like protein (DUF455 family)
MFAAETLRASCLRILTSGELDAKLAPLGAHAFSAEERALGGARVRRPARGLGLSMHGGAARLPRPEELRSAPARALALGRFAHHELQAAELFAAALLRWPELPDALVRALAGILEDEQRHARAYLARLAPLGARFAELAPHSDYFWRHAAALLGDAPVAFFAGMGLTLEQANLDFAGLYGGAFAAAGDAESAAVCAQVHTDEIRHVALAAHALRALGVPGAGDTQRYAASVPFPFSAARAKGRRFDAAARRAAGLDAKFVAHVRHARSPQETSHAPLPRLLLLANLGAEEGERAERAQRAPQPRALTALWRSLWDEPPAFAWLPRAGAAAWLNDVRAEEAAREAGCALFGAPAHVVRAVHDKAFSWRVACRASLAPPLLRAMIAVLEPAELRAPDAVRAIGARVARWPAWAQRSFILKPRIGTSARGRASGGSTGDTRWQRALPRLADRGGAVLEPWLARSWDASAQLFVHAGGEVELLGTLAQDVTPAGAPIGHRGAIDASGAISSGLACDAELRDAALHLARAASAAGYRGPCGVDSFGFRDPQSGSEIVRAVVELNARFTLGTVAIGLVARALRSGAVGPPRPARFALALGGEGAQDATATRVALAGGRATLTLWPGDGEGGRG